MLRTCVRLINLLMNIDFSKIKPTIDDPNTVFEYMLGIEDLGVFTNNAKDEIDLVSDYGYIGESITQELKKSTESIFENNVYIEKVQNAYAKFLNA